MKIYFLMYLLKTKMQSKNLNKITLLKYLKDQLSVLQVKAHSLNNHKKILPFLIDLFDLYQS